MIPLGCVFLTLAAPGGAAEPAPPPPAELRVHGLGWWRDRVMRNELTLLLKDQHRGQTYDANAIEDGAMLILAQLSEEGRLSPRLTIRATPPDGAPVEWLYQIETSTTLPRSWGARQVEYLVVPGLKYRIAGVEIEGLQALTLREGLAYFQDNSAFAGNPWHREYSPGGLRRMQQQLTNALRNLGYAEARVEATDLRINDETGAVHVRLRVTEGRLWQVAAVLVENENPSLIAETITRSYVGRPWCELLDHDLTNEVRNTCYRQGYPDVTVVSHREPGPVAADVQPVSIRLVVVPGPQIRRGTVHFEGARQTRRSLLENWVKLPPGPLLDPAVLEEARLDLARLGTFQSVDLSYQPGAEGVRDPVFTLRETQPWETSLLFGYGSYEQLRAGLEIRHFNFLGEAGVGSLKLVQSMKSTRGDLGYSFPQFFGHRLNSHVTAYALRREELQLERREGGLRLGFSRPLKFLGAVATAGYLYEQLRYEQADVAVLSTEPASGDTTAASLEFNLTRDQRDNFLRPREGYHWFFQSELANPSLGGSSEYQRGEVGMSYHRPLAQGAWLHVGLTHGVVANWGGADRELPVNKLFFPGGDNSIRGYSQGEAAPRNPDGTYSGARCYAVLNLETEFALAKNWSVVLFSDSLGEAVDMADYPFDTTLFSVGAGLRYQSIIGPVRLEYGYNLNPRPDDPSGTLLFSLGFPF